MTINKYYTQLTRAWQQIDVFEVHQKSCTTDSKLYTTITEHKRVFRFLTRLHLDFDSARSKIRATKPLLSLKTAFVEIKHEESRKKVMMGTVNQKHLP